MQCVGLFNPKVHGTEVLVAQRGEFKDMYVETYIFSIITIR